MSDIYSADRILRDNIAQMLLDRALPARGNLLAESILETSGEHMMELCWRLTNSFMNKRAAKVGPEVLVTYQNDYFPTPKAL